MTDQQLWLDPARVHRAGVDLVMAGQAITDRRNGIGAQIEAAGAERPWGKDDIGATFEQKYRGFEALVLKSWAGLGAYLTSLGADVVQSVNASVETDAANAARIGTTAG